MEPPMPRASYSERKKRYYLSTVELFRGLPPGAMEEIRNSARMFSAPKGTLLYFPEERSEVFFVLKRGRVHLYKLSPQGRKIVLAELEGGTCFGEMSLMGLGMYQCFAEAVEESLLCAFKRDDVLGLLSRFPRLALNLLEVVGRRLVSLEQILEDLAFRDTKARLASLLLRLSRARNGNTINLTHAELAERIGTHRETVTLTLKKLEDEGLIRCGRKKITILDEDGLRQLAESPIS